MHQKVIIPPIAKEINEKLEKLTKDEPDLVKFFFFKKNKII